ncbi:metal-dependent transcriptional regulator [Salinarchaeum chitinilyticum]
MAAGTRTATTCECRHPETCVDRQVGRYLVAIYWAALDGDGRARTGDVSDRVDVSPATVTETFERLANDGFVDYEKHRGVELTERGVVVASDLAGRACTVSRFFESELDVAIPATAGYRIGYVLPEEAIDRLDALVPEPSACCHDAERDPADCPVA